MNWRALLLTLLLGFATITSLWGIRRDLPHAPGSDEVRFLLLSAQMAAAGDPNPHWFGHPGSTFLYPFAAALTAASFAQAQGSEPETELVVAGFLTRNPSQSILIGRLISVGYGVLSLVLLCLIGDRAFGPPVGLVGTWFAILSPLTLDHVMMARTDGAGLFFGLLATWAILRLIDNTSRSAHLWAGFTLGLAIATRFFLAGLLPLLLLLNLRSLLHPPEQTSPGPLVRSIALGLVGIVIGLVLAAPFLLFELPTLFDNLAHETRTDHPGADGLDFLGNLAWYATVALPRSVPWPILGLAALGATITARRLEWAPGLLLGFIGIFVVGICLAPLHWGRWLIQILPLLALFAAAAVVRIVGLVSTRLPLRASLVPFVLFVSVAVVSARPAINYIEYSQRQARPSTRDEGRAWILDHLPPTTRITAELYTAPLQNSPFADTPVTLSLARIASSPQELRHSGAQVAMVSSTVYGRFFAEPHRFAKEVAFYKELFRKYERLAEFRPSRKGRGPVIRLFWLTRKPA